MSMDAVLDRPSRKSVRLGETVNRSFRRRKLAAMSAPVVVLAYLVYVFFAFDIPGVMSKARLDNVGILLSDFISYKTHVTRDNRNGTFSIAIEGEAKGVYPDGVYPDWIRVDGADVDIGLPQGQTVRYRGETVVYERPGHGVVEIRRDGRRIVVTTPDGSSPEWINASSTRATLTVPGGRISVTNARTDTFRYSYGWELFFFTLDSPFSGKGIPELFTLAVSGERIDPARSNAGYMVSEFLENRMWRHADVYWALFETLLMAFLGTMSAALIALPLAFMAASNFAPARSIRFLLRRLFDFVRGVDGLIWTIILSRAFGPGPLTGALAILMTDTGSFGKMFSEALENVDDRQIEGVRSTGANAMQRARFGVLPQVTPVFLSQVLYYFESNTRSATVIGAIVGGGIGLLLTQAIATQKDWEEVSYYIILVILLVMAMDTLSGWLRLKLIGRGTR